MQRINTTNKAVDLFGSGKHGFQTGVPASGVKATYLSELWCNAAQEELCALPEFVGLTLADADKSQNLKALAQTLQRQLMASITTTGTAPAYIGAISPAPTALVANLRMQVTFHVGNNGAPSTLNINGLGAKSIKQMDGSGALVDTTLFTNQKADVVYDGTVLVVLNPAPYNKADAGLVSYFATTVAPTGYLKANGAAISRNSYAALFAAIGTTFGTGDGSTTFNIPDLRGEFVRGWDDARGIDSTRVLGSLQLDAFQGHDRDLIRKSGVSDYLHGVGALQSGSGGTSASVTGSGDSWITRDFLTRANYGLPRVAGETRPRNVALLACIKY